MLSSTWILLLVAVGVASSISAKKIVCYYGSWAVYRPGDGRFDVEDIDPNICTHLNYAFLGINADGTVRIIDDWNDVQKGALNRFSGLKKLNPELKVLLAVGGWNEGSTTFSAVAKSPPLRAKFAESSIGLLETYGFDGIDLDWEYPAQRGGESTDVDNFTKLLGELRAAFGARYLLTAAVASAKTSANKSYDVAGISEHLDFINVMTYDLHGPWERVTGHNSPLSPSSLDLTDEQRELNVRACVDYWLSQGAPPEKLILGVGLFGRTFTLANPNGNKGLGAETRGAGAPGPYTRESGYLGYNEICLYIKRGGWEVVRDPEQQVPYSHKGDQWVGYDDPESIAVKVDYVIRMGLGGMMTWSVETDDFRCDCGLRNPLLNAIRVGFGLETSYGDGGECGSVQQPTTTTSSPPPPTDGICEKVGYVRDPVDCSVFYYCEVDGSGWRVHRFQCPNGLHFDPVSLVCNWSNLVPCP